ncbi:APC family permease [bacterium]|nr:APC family permease [bacterium]
MKKALITGTFLVIALYFLLNMIYLSTLNIDAIKTCSEDIVIASMMNNIFSSKGLLIIAIIIAISAIGCANGMILTGSRIYYKMAKDRLFFRPLAYIQRRTKVPVNSLWAQCIWICILILWGNYAQLLDYVIYSAIIFYIITIFGIFKMRKLYPDAPNVYKVPNFVPITFIVLASCVVIILTIFKPLYTVTGLFITLLGIPVYHFWKKS